MIQVDLQNIRSFIPLPYEAALAPRLRIAHDHLQKGDGAGGDFTLSEKCGQVVVINFWATWCTPCVAELPHFEALQKAYPDDVSVVAIHSNLVTDDVREFLNREAYALSFAQDTDGTVMTRLGGSTQLPMTVIVDRDGTIVYNRVGSMTFDRLTALIEPLL